MNASPNDDEVWRPIPGYEGFYSVSSHGRVLSEQRIIVRVDGQRRTVRARMMRLVPNLRGGYHVVKLSRGCVGKDRLVHQLVLEAFVGPKPVGMVCCHRDGNTGNQRLENLRWDTMASNSLDSIKHGVIPRGQNTAHARLRDDDVLAIRRDSRTQTAIAAEYDIDPSTVSLIKRRVTWTHI